MQLYNPIKLTLQDHISRFRVRHSFKICLASMICVIIAAFWYLEDPFFSVITVLLIMGLYANHAVVKGLERFIGSLIGVALGISFSDLSFELPPIFFISLTISLFVCMYFFAENRFAYAALQCAIMTAVTMITAGELLKLDLGIPIHRLIGIGVGVIVAWVILNFVWPARTKEDLNITLSEVFKECGDWFQSLKMFCMDCSPPGSSTHGIFQARVLEWGAIAFSYHLLLLLSRFSCVQ